MSVAPTIGRLGPAIAFGLLACATGALAGLNPEMAVIAAAGLAFALLVLASLYAGVALFILLTFVVEIPALEGTSISFAKIAGLLLVVSWLAVIATRPDARLDFLSVHPGVTYALVLFLAWIALSRLWAEDPAETLDTLFRLTLNAILVLIVFSAVRKPSHAVGVVAAFVAGAMLAAVYGLLFVTPQATGETARLSSGLENPNELATVLVAALAMSLGLAGALRESPLARRLAFMAAAVCVLGVFFTGSRGGLVSLSVALIAFLLIGARFRGRLLLVGLAVVAAGIGYYTSVASPEARTRLTDVESGTGRTDLWEVGWRMVEAEPLRGIGAGNFPVSSRRFLLEPGSIARSDLFLGKPKVAHNTYIEIWAELGLVGLSLFLFIVGFGLVAAARAARAFAAGGQMRMEMIARAVFVAMAAVLAADFFGSRQYNKELWFLLGLAAALLAISHQPREDEPGVDALAERRQRVGGIAGGPAQL